MSLAQSTSIVWTCLYCYILHSWVLSTSNPVTCLKYYPETAWLLLYEAGESRQVLQAGVKVSDGCFANRNTLRGGDGVSSHIAGGLSNRWGSHRFAGQKSRALERGAFCFSHVVVSRVKVFLLPFRQSLLQECRVSSTSSSKGRVFRTKLSLFFFFNFTNRLFWFLWLGETITVNILFGVLLFLLARHDD